MKRSQRQNHFDQWMRLAKAIESVPSEMTPPGLAQQVKARVQAAASENGSSVRAIPALRPGFAFVILALFAAAGTAVLFMSLATPHVPVTHAVNGAEGIMSRSFKVALHGAHRVAIAGDFNEWNPRSDTLTPTTDGFWAITLRLPSGNYQYQYIIDSTTWIPDPENSIRIEDGFGGYNSGLEL